MGVWACIERTTGAKAGGDGVIGSTASALSLNCADSPFRKVLRELEKEDNEITKLHEVEVTSPVTSFTELSSAAASTKPTSWWQAKAGLMKDESNDSNKTVEIRAANPSKQER